jgi:hypothetical protein
VVMVSSGGSTEKQGTGYYSPSILLYQDSFGSIFYFLEKK